MFVKPFFEATCSSDWIENMVKVCAIKAPGFGENRKANLQDLATLTGGEVLLLIVAHVARL